MQLQLNGMSYMYHSRNIVIYQRKLLGDDYLSIWPSNNALKRNINSPLVINLPHCSATICKIYLLSKLAGVTSQTVIVALYSQCLHVYTLAATVMACYLATSTCLDTLLYLLLSAEWWPELTSPRVVILSAGHWSLSKTR